MSNAFAVPLPGATLRGMSSLELNFQDIYKLEKRLRSGSYGTVYTTTHIATHGDYAVKVIDRTKMKKKEEDDAVFREVSVLRELIHIPGVIRLIDFFVRPRTFYVVQVYARGGDVFDRLAGRAVYTEKDAKELCQRFIQTIRDIHKLRFSHRDLKLENLLLQDTSDDTQVMVADFGFAKRIPKGGFQTRCGTPAFVAPEVVIGSRYNQSADMWSVGVCLFLLLGGYPPFQDSDQYGLFRKIRAADYVFHNMYWEHVSVEVKQVIANLLVVNPTTRMTAEEALECKWFHTKDEVLRNRDLSHTLSEIKNFNAKRKLKSAMHAINWITNASFFHSETATFSQQNPTPEFPVTISHPEGNEVAVQMAVVPIRFHDFYETKTEITKGALATVWECVHKDTNEVFAVKIIKREGLKPSDDEAVMNEVAILQSLVFESIVQLVDFYEEKDYFFLVMEHMQGGDVFDKIMEKSCYTEKDARDLAIVLLKAVRFMHSRGIAHRDLKPQNLLLPNKDDDADIKVADFGFAHRVHTPQSLTTRCGTPSYVAPEILKNIPHDQSVDMWSVGVIIYVLLVGYPPFMGKNQQELFQNIRTGSFEFVEVDWMNISMEAKALVAELLVVDPSQRLTAQDALRSSWIHMDEMSVSQIELTGALKTIRERRHRLRAVANAVVWMTTDSKEDPVPYEDALQFAD